MPLRKYVPLCIAIFLILMDCALALADDDWSFSRSRSRSSGGSGGSSDPMTTETMLTGFAMMGAAFCIACGAVFFLQTWLLTSLAASKVLALLGFFSFLAWPLFIITILPPSAAFLFAAEFYHNVGARDTNSALSFILLLVLAAFIYFYLVAIILAAFSSKSWGRRMVFFFVALAVLGGILGVIAGRGILPLILFACCACLAWAAWKAYAITAARAAAKKRPAAD